MGLREIHSSLLALMQRPDMRVLLDLDRLKAELLQQIEAARWLN
jgi:hypothetical protein